MRSHSLKVTTFCIIHYVLYFKNFSDLAGIAYML